MGLDMYLTGHKHFLDRKKPRQEDGFPVKSISIDLGYWRKHPNLHGFIVQAFAEGRDECQEIELDQTALQCIISAIKEKRLPSTTGFFFGASGGSEAERDLKLLEAARQWLLDAPGKAPSLDQGVVLGHGMVMHKVTVPDNNEYRTVIYQASW